jgi:hypothetical protein
MGAVGLAKRSLLIALGLVPPLALAGCASRRVAYPNSCASAREFITTHEYLRSSKDWRLTPDQARELAAEVARGCTGAAGRFVRVSETLLRAGLGIQDAARYAKQAAQLDGAAAQAFLTIFRLGFQREHLDLDLRTSLDLASSLSLQLEGDSEQAARDFAAITAFCAGESQLDLPKSECARVAARSARSGLKFEQSMGKPFERMVEFVRSSNGPGLPIRPAIELTQSVLDQGPQAVENFRQAYLYAADESGLALPRDKALAFARRMVALTVKPQAAPAQK